MNFQKLQKLQNASIVCGPTALVLKKVRHGEAKTKAELATVKFQKVFKKKVKKASIACRPTAPVRKKCDTWAKARGRQITLTMQIHTMQILISQILCVGKMRSRPAPGA